MSSIIFTKSTAAAFTDMPLEETLQWIEKISCQLADEIDFLKQFNQQHAKELADLLSAETINRFKGVALSLKYPFENFTSYEDPQTRPTMEQGFLVQGWSSLGSLLESTLQIFLSFYYHDYIKSEWYKWDSTAIQQISDELSGEFRANLAKLAQENEDAGKPGVTKQILKSFLEKAKYILKDKSDNPKIKKITLSPLIDFYFEEVFHDAEGEYTKEDLQKIRDYRNAIHAFQKREIGSWEEFNKHIKNLILLIIDMLNRLPDIPPDVPTPEWYHENRSTITFQETRWFQIRASLNYN